MSRCFHLEPDSDKRSRAILAYDVPRGTVLLAATRPMSTVLHTEIRGTSCDACLRQFPVISLKTCSGCRTQMYCGLECQTRAWNAHHRKLCKILPGFMASRAFQSSPIHIQLESLLLSQLVVDHFSSPNIGPLEERDEDKLSDRDILLTLLPHPRPPALPPLPPIVVGMCQSFGHDLARTLASHSINNHWVVYSSNLKPIAHAVVPRASRCFNHSCQPSAIQVYNFDGIGPLMEVRALNDMKSGAEITVPYLDPAHPYSIRQDALRSTYGFTCTCSRCLFDSRIASSIPPTPPSSSDYLRLYGSLVDLVFGSAKSVTSKIPIPSMSIDRLPPALFLLLNRSQLPYLSARFSDASHDGIHPMASEAGLALLAMYLIIYPSHYPLTGLHCLELAKTEWNRYVLSEDPDRSTLSNVTKYLAWAQEILDVSGSRGDVGGTNANESGPYMEIVSLHNLLEEEKR